MAKFFVCTLYSMTEISASQTSDEKEMKNGDMCEVQRKKGKNRVKRKVIFASESSGIEIVASLMVIARQSSQWAVDVTCG